MKAIMIDYSKFYSFEKDTIDPISQLPIKRFKYTLLTDFYLDGMDVMHVATRLKEAITIHSLNFPNLCILLKNKDIEWRDGVYGVELIKEY